MSSRPAEAPLPIGQARKTVADLMTPNPVIYWVDFLVSISVAYGAAAVYLKVPIFSSPTAFDWLVAAVSFTVSGIALFRVALFMHEIVHFRRGEMTAFKVAWNVLAGIPMLIPSFLYESHLAHHNTHHYGTGNDGEYLPLGVARFRNLLGFLAQMLFLPALVGFRFLVLTPLSLLHPRLRRWVLERASSFVINFSYRREIPQNAPLRAWAALDLVCCLRTYWIFSFLFLPFLAETRLFGQTVDLSWQGLAEIEIELFGQRLPIDLSWHRLPKIYCLAMFTLGLNHIRTLVAHRYQSVGSKMTFSEQFDDSVNVAGRTPLVALMFPVGLRYHALHHLFPSIPYHNLGEAHRRLIETLPEGSAYHRSTYTTFWQALRELLRSSYEACANPPPGCEAWFARRREECRPVLPEIGEEEAATDDCPAEPETTASR